MGKPKQPAPPDPTKTAAASTGTNIDTATANTVMGNVDQYGPTGSLTYDQTGTHSWLNEYTGETHNVPTYSATTSLTPEQQAIFDANQSAQLGLGETAAQQASFLKDYLGTPADFNTSEIEGRIDELGRQRLDPRFERERAGLEQRLASQGLTQGSAAWQAEMDRFGQTQNDAYNQLALTGRGQAFSELGAMRNQPINEITALLSGSQVSQPNFQMNQPTGIPTTDVAGLINQSYGQEQQNYQSELGSWNDTMGGMFGLASGGLAGGYF